MNTSSQPNAGIWNWTVEDWFGGSLIWIIISWHSVWSESWSDNLPCAKVQGCSSTCMSPPAHIKPLWALIECCGISQYCSWPHAFLSGSVYTLIILEVVINVPYQVHISNCLHEHENEFNVHSLALYQMAHLSGYQLTTDYQLDLDLNIFQC